MVNTLSIKSRLALGCFVVSALLTLGVCARTQAQTKPLVLLTRPDSTRAIALESVTFTSEPFPLDSFISWAQDRRTRVIIFALNLQLQPGESASNIIVDAEDAAHRHYNLTVESVESVEDQPWLTALNVRLSDNIGDVGDVLVRTTQKSRSSSRVRIAIGHAGGGLPDDPGSEPTPAPPYPIRGRITADGLGLPNVSVTITGTGSGVSTTDSQGNYLILAPEPGDYLLSVASPIFDFSQPSRTFVNLSNQRQNIDFTGSRQRRTILGQVNDDSGKAFPNLAVTITGGEPVTTRVATTDTAGSFAFPDLPAGFNYVVTATSTAIFGFLAQSFQLTANTNVAFNAVRRTYTLSGRVADPLGALADARLDLMELGLSTTSDGFGNYAFTGLPAGFNYTVAVSKPEYVFAPASAAFSQLDDNRQFDFQGTAHVILSGRILDGSGRAVAGVKVGWTGVQSGTTSTGIDGTYSFPLTAMGNYVLTPSKEQGYYSYAPAAANVTTSGNRVADFTATLNTSSNPSYVLEFDGDPKTVDYSMPLPGDRNLFWPDGLDYGHFFWEFWAMPGENAGGTYLISDGYGGAHAILFGVSNFGDREPGRYQVKGNIWDGHGLTYFASDEGPAPYEWGHFAAGWDGQNIISYFNGVPVGLTHWTGPRITPGPTQGCGRLLIGGSDHSNFIGRIAQVRGYENTNPREVGGNSVYSSFRPETVFSVDGNLLSYFFRPSENIADLSLYGHYGRQHAGLVRGSAQGIANPCPGCPLPQFVIDPTAPDFAHPDNPGQLPAPIENPASAPVGALVFDSFSRRNSTYVLGGIGGIGTTEGGTMGPSKWLNGAVPGFPQPFGILNGRAVDLTNDFAVTWVSLPSPYPGLDIRADRRNGYWGSGQNTGISFRVVDSRNCFFAYSSDGLDPSQPKKLTVGYYSDGLRTNLETGLVMPAAWTTLRVVTTTTGAITVYADGTILYATTNILLAGSDGAGLYNNSPGLGLANRWDNFTIFAAP